MTHGALRGAMWIAVAVVMLAASPGWAQKDDDEAPPPEHATAASDQTHKDDTNRKTVDKGKDKGKEEEKPQITRHTFSGTFNGEHVTYEATAAEMFLKGDGDKNKASLFSVSYVKQSTTPEQRPVTFVFNGGPGSASLWLHLGVFGPKAITLPPAGTSPGAPPYAVADNPISILDATDLVFIDPVGTGYSHAMGDGKDDDFWGMDADAKSISEFIRRWLTENQRWNSPKYIAGESYGTTRAAQLAAHLQGNGDGIYLNGIILMSSILDFHASSFQSGNDLPFVTYLPTYAAAAWYHGKIEPKRDDLDAFLIEVRHFAENEYATALMKGSMLSSSERAEIVKRVAHYTGLPEDYVSRANLRISASRFRKELLRDREKVIGRYDARIIGEDYDAAGESPEADPSFYSIDGAFTAAINDYLTRTLKVTIDRRYKILDDEPSRHWKWSEHPGPGSYVNVADDLGSAMRQNADLRVFTANGLYDLATPFFATEVTMMHNGIPNNRVTLTYFNAGHMMYTDAVARTALAREVRDFIKAGGQQRGRGK